MAVTVTGAVFADGSCGELMSSVTVCCVATTLTLPVPVIEPDIAVSVTVVPAATPAAEKFAVTVPFALVEVVAPDNVPALALIVTGALATALLLASFANTVITELALPSDGTFETLLVTVSVATVEPEAVLETVICVVFEIVPTVAVTVMAVPEATPVSDNVVVAWPLEFVVPVVLPKEPPFALNVTVAPETGEPEEFVTTAVIVAGVLEFGAMLEEVLLTATAATPEDVVPVHEPPEDVPVVLPPPLKLPHPSLLPLPQPASASVSPNKAMIDANLRMFLT